ncbi:lysine--tRNA ligase [Bacillus sp. EAC]|uniref:lysine--tRNA ligase n=1 Tax=Bacillus sp. EAC TaxID=1978338 RepID=UPI000B42EEFF|nr:lysine--tRNA ligase [Bacillus sp. EAC]
MHWAINIAKELINQHPEKDTFVCASGISPSGSVHVGNFREVVTTYFVVKALRKLGKKAKFIFSWDDYDRFRKVPKNIDPSYEKYLGMAYFDIPDPFGCHSSYAEHFEKEFEKSLEDFGIEIEFIYQNKEYQSGRYNKHILHAIKMRKEIYDILMKYKTNSYSIEERNTFYPITIYCENCKKDNTHINQFDELNGTLNYRCTCGFSNRLNVLDATNMKLNWKIDWAMRWLVEDVIFEPGGRDHSSATGSYTVSKEIAKQIFNFNAPHYAPYEFIGIKGENGKMSSSSGNIITPNELLNIYLPEIILFMFAKYHPSSSFNIGLDEDVIKQFSEFERYRANYEKHMIENEDISFAMELSQINHENFLYPKFNQVASILPLLNFNVQLLKEAFENIGETYSIHQVNKISRLVEYWIKNWQPQKNIRINQTRAFEYYHSLENDQKNWLEQLRIILQTYPTINDEEIMKQIYAICHNDNKKLMKQNQKLLFTIVYTLVLNTTSGPPLPLLIKAIGLDKIISLIDFR